MCSSLIFLISTGGGCARGASPGTAWLDGGFKKLFYFIQFLELS